MVLEAVGGPGPPRHLGLEVGVARLPGFISIPRRLNSTQAVTHVSLPWNGVAGPSGKVHSTHDATHGSLSEPGQQDQQVVQVCGLVAAVYR